MFFSCDTLIDSKKDNIKEEKQKIVNLYHKWSQKLIAQDYDGALSLVVPGSNGEGMTNVAKEAWDKGGQHYFTFTYVQAELDEEDLKRNYGRAKGNLIFYQYNRAWGKSEYELGFYSSCRKIANQWKIDGCNSNLEVDWWR